MDIENANMAIRFMDERIAIDTIIRLKKINCFIKNMKQKLKDYETERDRIIYKLGGNNRWMLESDDDSGTDYDDDCSIDDHNSVWGGAGPDCIVMRLETA